jgi:mono/diheme cytochrome c family protein
MKNATKIMVAPVLGALAIGLMAFAYQGKAPSKEWVVPAADAQKKNPTKADKASTDVGRDLWGKYCKSCHGKMGEGDGSKAEELKTELSDFTQAKFQGQSDGALFYKITKGRDEMPSSHKKNIEDEDVWNIINFVRSFGKK